MNPDEFKDLPQIEVGIGPGGAMTGKTSFVDFAPSGVEMEVDRRIRALFSPSTKVEISTGPPRWLDKFMRSDAWAFMRGTTITRSPRFPMAGKTMFDTLTPSYLADLWLRRLLSRACLDDMSEAELVSMRTHIKNRTFEVRLVNDETGRHAAQRLDELTTYMRRRFPRRGSTPPCEAVCV